MELRLAALQALRIGDPIAKVGAVQVLHRAAAQGAQTRDDLAARMALVPRTLEARGLDATPAIQRKLARAGDARAVAILAVILRDEVGHVAIGNRWYRWACARAGLEPLAHYALLAQRHAAPWPKPPFHLEARRAAGFDDDELAALSA